MNTVERVHLEETTRGSTDMEGFKRKTSWRHYLLAVTLVLFAFAFRCLLNSIIGEELPFMLFIATAIGAAWYGGALSGFLALLLGLVLAGHFVPKPQEIIGAFHLVDFVRLFRYVFTGSLGIVLIELLRRGQDRANATAEKLRHEVERRKQSEAALEQAKNLLSKHNEELEHRVTERTAELSASVKSLEGILYHIAHNFHAPARAMKGFITLLEDDYGQNWDAQAHDYANRISASAKHMERLIKDLLDYGRLTHVHVRLAAINLERAIDAVLAELSGRIETANADTKVERPLPDVCADSDILNQVLFQLLDNAIKFVPPGTQPRVRIWAERHDSMVRLWVQDNGVGIEPQHRERVFLPFERQKIVEGYEGNGVGLAVVKEGMQRMRGSIGVESRVGAGSRFWIELPTAAGIDESQELRACALSE